MGYPFVLAYNGKQFARLCYDGNWSIKWDQAIDVRYQELNSKNKAIIACAIIVVAAKDNFYVTPWELSDNSSDKWVYKSKVIDIVQDDPTDGSILFNISKDKESFARVNFDGTWSINWDIVEELSRESLDVWQKLALVGFCKLLKAAKDNFYTTPWSDDNEDDE
jgi:hypothetical protein